MSAVTREVTHRYPEFAANMIAAESVIKKFGGVCCKHEVGYVDVLRVCTVKDVYAAIDAMDANKRKTTKKNHKEKS